VRSSFSSTFNTQNVHQSFHDVVLYLVAHTLIDQVVQCVAQHPGWQFEKAPPRGYGHNLHHQLTQRGNVVVHLPNAQRDSHSNVRQLDILILANETGWNVQDQILAGLNHRQFALPTQLDRPVANGLGYGQKVLRGVSCNSGIVGWLDIKGSSSHHQRQQPQLQLHCRCHPRLVIGVVGAAHDGQ
jgi:hypothetical protein